VPGGVWLLVVSKSALALKFADSADSASTHRAAWSGRQKRSASSDGMRGAFQHSQHPTSIPALEHYGVQVEGDSDEQHDVAVHGVIMEKVRDRQHDRNDTGQPVYAF